MSNPESIKRPLKIYLGIVAITVLVLGLVFFRTVFLAAAVAIIGGVLLEPVIRWMRVRWRLPHGLSVGITAVLVFGGLAGMLYGGYRLIAGQVQRLAEQAPEIKERLLNRAEELMRQFPWLKSTGAELNLGEHAQGVFNGLLKVLAVGIEGAASALLVMMLALFIAANFRPYGRGFLTLFPVERRPRVSSLGWGSIGVVRKWFFGQVLVVTITATLTGLALLIIGMDYWLLIAAITLPLSFIPFVGAILTGIIAVVLTLGTDPDKVVWVLLAYFLIQQIEGDLILPIVMKGRVRMPEAHLLLFLLIMGTSMGIVGVFLATPLFAVLHYLYCQAYVPWVERRPATARDTPVG